LHLAGQGQVTFQIFLAECLLVQLGIVNRNPRLHADTCENLQVFPTELLPLVQRVQLDHPQSLALRVQQGAHIIDRMRRSAMLWLISVHSDIASSDKTASLDSITRRTIVRLMRIASSLPLRALVQGAASSAIFGLQDDETAVGLEKDLEKAVQDLRQYFVQSQRAAQIAGDLEHRGQTAPRR
jgi:hypothetical protein